MAEGARTQIAEIRGCISRLEEKVSQLEGAQAGFVAEYEQNLKWMALEIASKVLGKRIEEDDTEMASLVKEAVNTVWGAKWITVEISDAMPGLLDLLAKNLHLADGGSRVEVHPVQAPAGTCIIDTPSGLIDASVYTQLENLKEYFAGE